MSAEASLDQQTMRICLQELRRCQQLTPRPNFVALLGQRYGWRPLPAEIPAGEFEALRANTAVASDRDLLSHWYSLDRNAVPEAYYLRRRQGVYEELTRWGTVEGELRRVLLAALPQLGLSAEARLKYECSATEQEILEGALSERVAPAFLYRRVVRDLPAGPSAYRDGEEEAEARLEDLVARLERRLPREHRHTYHASWGQGAPTTDHLSRLCEDLYQDLSAAIREEIARAEVADAAAGEGLAHWSFAGNRAADFLGRHDAVEQVMAYLRSGPPRPLVVSGVSGSGKSALLATCLLQAAEDSARTTTLLCRFVGATPGSTELHSLLRGMCLQLRQAYRKDEKPLPADVKDLELEFAQRLAHASSRRALVIVIDALDQLSPADGAHYLNWLPAVLPPHVRLIVSVLDREEEVPTCLAAARRRLPDSPFLQVRPLRTEEGDELLTRWLSKVGRTLTDGQRQVLLERFERCPYPLYLKLAFEEGRLWKSGQEPPRREEVGGSSEAHIEDMVRGLLLRLEAPAEHGEVLVRKSLGYLVAGRNGLSEEEMLGALSRDDEVWGWLADSAHHELPERRLPWAVWSRLYGDLQPYLMERAADGTSLMAFYHRQVADAVAARYLTADRGPGAHADLARYFAALVPVRDDRDRVLPHLRQLAELPYQCTRGEVWPELRATLTSLEFLESKCEAGQAFDLAMDFTRANAVFPEGDAWRRNLRLLEQALRSDLHFLSRRPGALFQCLWNRAWWYDCAELASYCEPPEGGWGPEGPPWQRPETERLARLLEGWLAQKQQRTPGFEWLRSRRPPPFPLGGAQVACLRGHQGPVNAVAFSPDGSLLVSASDDGTARIWDARSGQELACLRGHQARVNSAAFAPDGRLIATGSADDTARVWDLESGRMLAQLEGHEGTVEAVCFAADGRVVTGAFDNTVGLWNWSARRTSQFARLRQHSDWVQAVAVSADGTLLASGSGDARVCLWEAQHGRVLFALAGHGRPVYSVAFSPDGRKVVSGSLDRTVRVWSAVDGKPLHCLLGHQGYVRSVAFAPDGRLVVSGSDDQSLRLWDAERGGELAYLRGHEGGITGVGFSPDGQRLVSCSLDGTVRLWDVVSAERTLVPHGHQAQVSDLAFSPDGRRLASGSYDHTVRLWDTASGEQHACLRGHKAAVRGVAFSPDGVLLVSASDDKTLRLWDVERREVVRVLKGHEDAVTRVAFSPDGTWIASGSGDQTIRLWEVRGSREPICLHGHYGYVSSVAFSRDGRRIVSAGGDRTVRVWDWRAWGWGAWRRTQGRQLACLRGHSSTVTEAVFSADGRQVISRAADRTVRVWSLATKYCLREEGGADDVAALAAGRRNRPLRAVRRDYETAIEATTGPAERAHWPQQLGEVVAHPAQRLWAGMVNEYLALFSLEEGSGYEDSRRRPGSRRGWRLRPTRRSVSRTPLRAPSNGTAVDRPRDRT